MPLSKDKRMPPLRAPARGVQRAGAHPHDDRADFDDDAALRPPRRPRRLPWMRAFYWLMVFGLWGVIGSAGMLAYYAYTLPDTRNLGLARVTSGINFLGFDRTPLGSRGDTVGEPVTLRDVPPYLLHAVIATEDRRFYTHHGIDPQGLLRAMWANLRAGRLVQGGSTITQQLAKNVFLTPERSVRRKAQEFLLALWLERQFSKEEILSMYLNRVYLGSGAYGVSAASRKYFGKPASELELQEAALIAGLLKAPSRYSPANDAALSQARVAQVLANMAGAGFLDSDQAAAAQKHKLQFQARADTKGSQYFFDWVIDQLPDLVGSPAGDLVVLTSIDARIQQAAEKAASTALERDGERLRAGQVAILALAPDGAIRAMTGGRNYGTSQFNRATQARRQPGSAFKPFVYLTALQRGMTPDSVMRDSPLILNKWSPRNFDKAFRGEVSLREALRYSINTVAVKVSEKAGRQQVIETAHRLGIISELSPTPALALGVSEVSLMELTSAYAPFANGGYRVTPYGILEVRDANGRLLYRHRDMAGAQVIGAREYAQINSMLSDALHHGTGRAARLASASAAGKTGTSQDYRDGWFIGYTPQLIAGIWFGNDNGAPMKSVTGGGLPARTWKHFMDEALAGQARQAPVSPFSPEPVIKPVEDLVSRFWKVFRGN